MLQRCLLIGAICGLFSLPVAAQPCDTTHRPLILVHGFLGAGDNYGPMLHKLFAAGYCPHKCFVYDWNSLERVDQSPLLDRVIDSILSLTGATHVDLAGHSAGGGVAGAYLQDAGRMKKVARYVHIGSTLLKSPAGADGSIPTLNIYSTADRVIKGGDIPGATNLKFSTYDHFEVVTADSVAAALYEFLNPGKIYRVRKLIAVPHSYPAKGRVLSLGQNKPQPGTRLKVHPVRQDDGTLDPVGDEVTADLAGRFALKGIKPYQPYMIFCYPPVGRAVAYYFPRIESDEQLLYLRTLPAEGMVSMLLGSLPADPAQSVMVLFSNQRAIIHGRDVLEVNGANLSTAAFADPSKTAVAWFLYDGNSNRQSDETLIAPLSNFPFMRAVDVMNEAGSSPIVVKFAGKEYRVPALPSGEFITIVVL